MFKLQTRIDEESDIWDDVIDVKLSKTKTTTKIFFTEESAEEYLNTILKVKSQLYRIESVSDEPIS